MTPRTRNRPTGMWAIRLPCLMQRWVGCTVMGVYKWHRNKDIVGTTLAHASVIDRLRASCQARPVAGIQHMIAPRQVQHKRPAPASSTTPNLSLVEMRCRDAHDDAVITGTSKSDARQPGKSSDSTTQTTPKSRTGTMGFWSTTVWTSWRPTPRASSRFESPGKRRSPY